MIWEKGMLAKSIAGHDKDRIYIIIEVTDSEVYLSDGELRTIDKPKKKKKKHIQLIKEKFEILDIDDVRIKRILREYKLAKKD